MIDLVIDLLLAAYLLVGLYFYACVSIVHYRLLTVAGRGVVYSGYKAMLSNVHLLIGWPLEMNEAMGKGESDA